MKEQIARSVFWLAWSRGVVQAISLLSTVAVARLLSPRDYGLMALAGIWTTTIALLAELGLGSAIIQFPDPDERELNTFFWLIFGTAVAGYLALYACAPAIAVSFATPMLSDVLRVAGLSLPLVAFRVVPESLLRKRLELDKVSQAELVSVVVTVPVVFTLAWVGAGVWALVAGTLLMPAVQDVLTFRFMRWWPGLRLGSRRLGEILRYSLASLGAKAGWAAYQQVDTFVLGKVAGDLAVGFYSMAKTVAILPVHKVSVVANQLAAPVMAGLQADRDAMRVSFLRGLRLVACLTVPVCLGTALVADDLVRLALGEKWTPMVPLLQVLAVFGLIHSLEVLLPPVLFARYRAAFLFWWTAGVLLLMPFPFWAGAAWLGALGVALAWVVIYPLIMAWMVRAALRELEIGWRTVWSELRPVAEPALIMGGCVFAVHWTIPAADPPERLLRLALAVGVGTLVYGGWLRWRGGVLRGEIRELAGLLYGRRSEA